MNRALQPAGGVAARVERLVIGADFGADGYTTVEQADELARRLGMRPGLRVLDLGSGELTALDPPGVFADKLTRRGAVVAAIEAGLLRRSLLLGTRPARLTAPGPSPARAGWVTR